MQEELEGLIQRANALIGQGGRQGLGYNGERQPEFLALVLEAEHLISQLGPTGVSMVAELQASASNHRFYEGSLGNLRGMLQAALSISKRPEAAISAPGAPAPPRPGLKRPRQPAQATKVFVVHGRDDGIKHQVARFIERLGIDAVIMDEQPNRGQTLIEKFEANADVAYAVVNLTPDDVGGLAGSSLEEQRRRARQNVIFELGYFAGKLGRGKVCALYDPSVEMPSNYQGVTYIELNDTAQWQLILAKEMKDAGISVDLNRL